MVYFRKLKHVGIIFLSLAFIIFGLNIAQSQNDDTSRIHVLNVNGAIGPAVTDYLDRAFEKAARNNADMIVIQMHTPGGLVTSMQDIVQNILSSDIPVATYVSPSGSHAASAGTFILFASHIAAMAPATNIGAATPVQMGGREDVQNSEDKNSEKRTNTQSIELKSVNDAVAYIRGLADLRGRNADWAEQAVREAVSLGANEAQENNVIEFIASDLNDLLSQLNGHEVTIGDTTITLNTVNAEIIENSPNLRTQILMIITDPNIAFLLMTIGFYGLIYEFANPGAFVPGIIGAICLAVGLFAMNVLPVNYAGILLLLFGIALMSAEALIPSFGILGIAGAISFAIGGVILIDTDLFGFGVSWEIIAITTALSVFILVFLLGLVIRAHKRKVSTGEEALIGSEARITKWSGQKGEVITWGERWSAVSNTPMKLNKDDIVYITSKDKLTLTITDQPPADQKSIKGE